MSRRCVFGIVFCFSVAVQARADVYRWWPLDDGEGDVAKDVGPHSVDGEIFDFDIDGLGDGGSVWVNDAERGTVLGVNGAWVEAGTIPVLELDTDFSWGFWAKQDESQASPSNVIIVGNRYDEFGADTSPREFVKFTPNRFEYHMDAGVVLETNPDGTESFLDDLQYIDCDFCPERHIPSDGEWIYHTVVKDGPMLSYYRDGVLGNTDEIETDQLSEDPLPFNMGGQNNAETWIGYLSDVRLWDHALTADEVVAAMGGTNVGAGDFNADGVLDASDIDALTNEINSGGNGTAFDLNGDGAVDGSDRTMWIKDLKNTWIGDSNLDGEFNSSDFVQVFGAGEYEDAATLNSTWATGDWNGDGEFNSSDFVAAFGDGGFELGPRVAATVPEPSGLILCLLGFSLFAVRRP